MAGGVHLGVVGMWLSLQGTGIDDVTNETEEVLKKFKTQLSYFQTKYPYS